MKRGIGDNIPNQLKNALLSRSAHWFSILRNYLGFSIQAAERSVLSKKIKGHFSDVGVQIAAEAGDGSAEPVRPGLGEWLELPTCQVQEVVERL
ncbi:hypothetical protein chiPu_0010183 [Chiloscyllium punctatum]|uniref:Uncharacterized protein n=1 Tax=Chiloscyllium punctatum TaxID=137246 RepID=A0A401SMV1_CHIPU|nr:hypothetical protein [Chiloscyllium punctatum]